MTGNQKTFEGTVFCHNELFYSGRPNIKTKTKKTEVLFWHRKHREAPTRQRRHIRHIYPTLQPHILHARASRVSLNAESHYDIQISFSCVVSKTAWTLIDANLVISGLQAMTSYSRGRQKTSSYPGSRLSRARLKQYFSQIQSTRIGRDREKSLPYLKLRLLKFQLYNYAQCICTHNMNTIDSHLSLK